MAIVANVAVSSGNLAATLFLLAATASPSAAQVFPTAADSQRYVVTAHADIVEHGAGELPAWVLSELNRLAGRFGLDSVPIRRPQSTREQPSQQEVDARADSLLRSLGPVAGLREAVALDTAGLPLVRYPFMQAVVRTSGIATLLDAAAALEMAGYATTAALQTPAGTPAEREDSVRAWLARTVLLDAQHMAVRAELLRWLMQYDADRALSESRADPDPLIRGRGILFWLSRAAPELAADELLDEGIRAALELTDETAREPLLGQYGGECERRNVAPCRMHGVPAEAHGLVQLMSRYRMAVSNADLSAADSLLAEVERSYLPEASLLSLVASTLGTMCVSGQACSGYEAPLTTRWLPRLEAYADVRTPQADTVRATLAQLHAGRDAERALAYLRSIEDPALTGMAGQHAGRRAYGVDFRGAVALTLAAGRATGSLQLPTGDMYTRLMSLGEDDIAAELLSYMGPMRRFSLLPWAELLHGAGRNDEARAVARAVLRDWDTGRHPQLGTNHLWLFRDLGLSDEVVEWAWSFPPGPARAGALLTVITGLQGAPGGGVRSRR